MKEHTEKNAGGTPSAAPEACEALTPSPARGKKPFVEPSVSVPTDVLEATALFQAPTVQTSVVP